MVKFNDFSFKKNPQKMEQFLKDQLLKNKLTKEKKKEAYFHKLVKRLKITLPVPIIIGLTASFLMYYLYGAKTLIETLLSWTIGMTIIAFIITSILSKYEKQI